MKRTFRILSVVVLAVALILFIPIPKGSYDDGGTREYEALTYKIVRWNRITGVDDVYRQTRVYWGQDKRLPIDDLWHAERLHSISSAFDAVIIELSDNHAVVTAMPYEQEKGLFSFPTANLNTDDLRVGDTMRISYTGEIRESYPQQIDVVEWINQQDLCDTTFKGEWLVTSTTVPSAIEHTTEMFILSVYENCFFAQNATTPDTICKINGTLANDWCSGDRVLVTYRDYVYDATYNRAEMTLIRVEPAESVTYAKPVIYLYPEETTEVDVTLTLDGELTCTYPAYKNGWHVTASPDGTLTDASGQIYNYLYWEGDTDAAFDMSRGFCIKGEDTAAFLETALSELGLTRREANECIVYWLPLMQENPYNLIAFQGDAYTDAAQLAVSPAPDTLIRVFMTWRASDRFVELEPQTLTAPARVGFTAVEWGGTELK